RLRIAVPLSHRAAGVRGAREGADSPYRPRVSPGVARRVRLLSGVSHRSSAPGERDRTGIRRVGPAVPIFRGPAVQLLPLHPRGALDGGGVGLLSRSSRRWNRRGAVRRARRRVDAIHQAALRGRRRWWTRACVYRLRAVPAQWSARKRVGARPPTCARVRTRYHRARRPRRRILLVGVRGRAENLMTPRLLIPAVFAAAIACSGSSSKEHAAMAAASGSTRADSGLAPRAARIIPLGPFPGDVQLLLGDPDSAG